LGMRACACISKRYRSHSGAYLNRYTHIHTYIHTWQVFVSYSDTVVNAFCATSWKKSWPLLSVWISSWKQDKNSMHWLYSVLCTYLQRKGADVKGNRIFPM
jgi:hypothetical protein